MSRPALSPPRHIAYIALGSNLGDRFRHLQDALDRLPAHDVTPVGVSPVYESAAHTLAPDVEHPPFLNAVARCETALEPEALLDACMAVERAAGRERVERWQPRTIDLDLIAYDDRAMQTVRLQIPHPRIAERRFVLQPLADLEPHLRLPAPLNATVYSLLQSTPDRGEVRRYPRVLTISE